MAGAKKATAAAPKKAPAKPCKPEFAVVSFANYGRRLEAYARNFGTESKCISEAKDILQRDSYKEVGIYRLVKVIRAKALPIEIETVADCGPCSEA